VPLPGVEEQEVENDAADEEFLQKLIDGSGTV